MTTTISETTPAATFAGLGLAPTLLATLEAEGYARPTPIQVQAIPPVLAGRDVQGIAQTGTGKTAAFSLPLLQRLAGGPAVKPGQCRALILAPTRELAAQIADAIRTYGRGLSMSVATIFGGVAHGPQRDTLRKGVDILVATPGRLLDHLGERNIRLDAVETFILDEADQMLDLGFVIPIRRIVKMLPQKRQTLFFSATMPKEIGALAAEILRDAVHVSVAPQATTAERVSQAAIFVDAQHKRAALVDLLGGAAAAGEMGRTLVFTRTKHGANKVAGYLAAAGIPSAAIHGNKSQAQRTQALAAFKAGRTPVLVATDIAARGIDVDGVMLVVNFELPNVPESYVHRIGRTARAGNAGLAVSLVAGDERGFLKAIEKTIRQPIPATDRRGDPAYAALSAELGAGKDAEIEARRGGAPRGQAHRQGPRGGRPKHAHEGGARGHERAHGADGARGGQAKPRSDAGPGGKAPGGHRQGRPAKRGPRPGGQRHGGGRSQG